jgi:hypothetical protein
MEERLVNTDQPSINMGFSKPALRAGLKPSAKGVVGDGFGTEWLSFANEGLSGKMKPNNFEIEVDEGKLLKLCSLNDLSEFSSRYAVKGDSRCHIDWPKVAETWGGIELTKEGFVAYKEATFQKELPELNWLFGWDLRSGCIWDSSAVIASKKLSEIDPRLAALRFSSPSRE